ncbi:MAG: YoaK family protein [Asticcacaulis sp.]
MTTPLPMFLGSSPPSTLPVAALLILAAGMLDAYTFVAHGAVFANAMTGNIVILMVRIAHGDVSGAEHYVAPIIAYVCGIAVAHTLKEGPVRDRLPSPARVSLALEIAFLAVVAFLPARAPSMAIVAGIAFVAALQATAFTRVGPFAYTSVTTSANLRRLTESVMAAVVFREGRTACLEMLYFLIVCACFFAGALCEAFVTYAYGRAAVWLPILVLSIAMALCLPWNRPVHDAFETN